MTYLDKNQHCIAESCVQELEIRVLKIYMIFWNFSDFYIFFSFFPIFLFLEKLLLKNEEKSMTQGHLYESVVQYSSKVQ